MRVAITQANYLPWLGFFELLDKVELWVNLDNVQVTRRSFIVRNRVRTLDGRTRWLTVPLEHQPRATTIAQAVLAPGPWPRNHFNVVDANYRQAEFFHDYRAWLRDLLRPRADEKCLSSFNERVICEIAAALGVTFESIRASQLEPELSGTPQQKILSLLGKTEATEFFNFQRGVEVGLYDAEAFAAAGYPLRKQEYQHPSYRQQGDQFIPYLTVVDLLLNEGPRSLEMIQSGACWVDVLSGERL